jgi:hypothetical protein
LKPAKKLQTGQDQAVNDRIDAEIDRVLATEGELIPSSGFMASVMERVQEEAAAPAPIPFPWKRAVPGILLTAGVFGWGAVELVRAGLPALGSLPLPAPHLSAADLRSFESIGWVALALGTSLVSWLFSRRLAGRGGLL